MPGMDGTGPFGKGPLTGGARGGCGLAADLASRAISRRAGWGTGALVAMAIGDISRPNGLIRSLLRRVGSTRTGSTISNVRYEALEDRATKDDRRE